jgi:hypothetical protein
LNQLRMWPFIVRGGWLVTKDAISRRKTQGWHADDESLFQGLRLSERIWCRFLVLSSKENPELAAIDLILLAARCMLGSSGVPQESACLPLSFTVYDYILYI